MYKTVFLDLDNTIFSFDQMYENTSCEAIEQIIGFDKFGVGFEEFYRKFREIADILYFQYEEGKRTIESYHDERWIQTLKHFNVPITPRLLVELNDFIQENYLQYVEPYAGAEDFLQKLSHSYSVGLITNGPVDMQMSKLIKMDLVQWFDPNLIIISEQIGVSKPHPKIFIKALENAGIDASRALHLGDSVKHDIYGANYIGMDSALIHGVPHPELASPTYQFRDFFEANKILLD
jgi:HAD superfamily hydrolase (TIGR01549 family)